MNYKTISEMFVGTTDRCSEKKLFYYKKGNDWIGLNGKDILITVEDISFGLRSLGIEPNSNIAIISNNSPKWAMCDYGIICSKDYKRTTKYLHKSYTRYLQKYSLSICTLNTYSLCKIKLQMSKGISIGYRLKTL